MRILPGTICEKIDLTEGVEIVVGETENIGSLICHSTGHISGLEGRLNPILDTSNRNYIYANNIAINGGMNQPVTFRVNEPIHMEDCHGVVFQVTVRFIASRVSLLEYVKPIYER